MNSALRISCPGVLRPLLEGGARLRLVVPILATAALSACATPTNFSESSVPKRLSVGYAAPGGQNELLLQLTTEGLLQTTPQGEHEPRLAEDWLTSDDGLTVDVRLRTDVTFHDGARLDADLVADFLDEARRDPRRLNEHPALGDIESIERVTPDRIRINLTQPSALLLDALAVRIERQDRGIRSGTGPFAVSNETEGEMTFLANRSYYRGPPAVDTVTVTTYPTHRAAWVAMMRDEIDFLFEVPISAREFVEAESSVGVYATTSTQAFTIGFNMRGPVFESPVLRRALNHAVDRRAVVDRALAGNGRPASGIWAPHWVYGGVERVYPYDPVLADELLEQAGHPMPHPSSSVSGDDAPARFTFTCLIPANTAPFEEIAVLVQRQLHEVGVHMRLESVDPRALERRITDDAWDAVLVPQQTGKTLARLYSLYHSAERRNYFGYSGADELLDALRHAATRDALALATAAFQRRLYDDPPAIFLAEEYKARAVSRRFEIPPVLPGRDIIFSLWQWKQAD